jgi:hypothetical protein
MDELGFKALTEANWSKPDPTTLLFGRLTADGPRSVTGEEWLKICLAPILNKSVPIQVRRIYEVSRGSLAYGYYFYPLYTLAYQQLYRVLDTATLYKCRAENAPKMETNSFSKRIDWLFKQCFLPPEDRIVWDACRRLRNYYSHPEDQTIMGPNIALGELHVTADRINQLFPD